MGAKDIELQRAKVLAEAQAALQADSAPPPEERSLGEQVLRGAGLAARAGGPTAAGAALGAGGGFLLGGPALALPGAGAGALSMNIVKMVDAIAGTNYFDKLMDKMGLPKPETSAERVASAASEGAANMGGMIAGAALAPPTLMAGASKAAPAARNWLDAELSLAENASWPPIVRDILGVLAKNPGVGISAAASGGGSQEAVKEAGGGPVAQMVGNVAGSMAVPFAAGAVGASVRGASQVLKDTVQAVGAAVGHKPSIERLTSDAIKSLTKENPEVIRQALAEAKTYVGGAKPTVAEAIAQENLRRPTEQVGGAVVKMQDQLAKTAGVEDILQSTQKSQEAAIKAHLDRLDLKTAPMRQRALEAARLQGAQGPYGPFGLGVQVDLQRLGAQPGYRASKTVSKALADIGRQLQKVTDPKTGNVDPEDLYMIRKGVGDTIRGYVEAPGGDKRLAGKVLGQQVQASIDKAMISGGAVGWRSYLQDYSRGMRAVELHRARVAEAKSIAQGLGARAPGELVKEEMIHFPTLLHRPVMFANYLLNKIAMDATTPVMRELATRMQDPKAFAELMARPAGTPAAQETANILTHAAVLANLIQKHQQDQGQLEAQPAK